MKRGNTTIQPELILFLSVLIYTNPEYAIPFLFAATLHELGHITMLHCIKHCTISTIIGLHGAEITTGALDYRQKLLTTLAGPAANFLGLLYRPLSPAFAIYNLILGLYNLLPLPFLDGGTILHTILAMRLPLDRADLISRIIAMITALFLFITGIIAAYRFGIFPLLLSVMIGFRCIEAYYLVS